MEYKKLGDICKVVSGGTPKRSTKEFWDNGKIPWIKISDIKNKYVTESEEYITEEGLAHSSAKMLPKGTILYTIFATLGETGILNIDACTNQAIAGITIKNPEYFLTEYLYYYLKSKKIFVSNIGRGVAQNNINMSILRDFRVPIVSIKDQKNITNVLNRVELILHHYKNELDKLDYLIKARFVEMFGDPVSNSQGRQQVPFSKFITNIRYGTSQPPKFSASGEYKFIRATNIKNGRIIPDDIVKIDKSEASKIEKCKLAEKEIIIVRSGVNAGDTCIVTNDYQDQYAGYDIIVTLDLGKSNPVFFNELLNTHYMSDVVKPLTIRSAQPHLNSQQVQNLPMIVASFEEQNEFAAFVQQVDKSKFFIFRIQACYNIFIQIDFNSQIF